MVGKVLDFAGGGAVHGVGGVAALVGAYMLGPRTGRFVEQDGKIVSVKIPGHNMVLVALGALVLWFGFIAFNGGSGYDIVGEGALLTGRVATITILAGATGACSLLFFTRITQGYWDMMMAVNGLLAGMIATCSCCNVIDVWASLIVGCTGAFVALGQSYVTEHVFHIDDPLDAAALHMGSGFWGTLMAGVFANPDFVDDGMEGLFFGGGKQFGQQIVAVLAYGGWAFATSMVMFGGLHALDMLRVSPEVEEMGLDDHHHGGYAYRIKADPDELAALEKTKHFADSDDTDSGEHVTA